jgi:DNA-directed RNA polymerase II subunit RPB2
MTNIQNDINKLIRLYFKQPSILYEHLFCSYQQFVEEIIPYCLKHEHNYFYENMEGTILHSHGFKCDNIRIKPATFDNDNEIKFPCDARKNHLNYFATVIIDIKQVVEIVNILTGEKTIKEIYQEKDIAVANIPIMVKSKYCSTHIKKDIKGECKYDPGGYFIVNGAEKIIMSIEKMVDNKILIFTKKDTSYENGLIYTAQINSRKNDWSDNLQIVTMKNKKDGVISISTSQLLDIPLFVLMRALGLENDQDIISNITYNNDDIKMVNLLRASLNFCEDENGNPIKTKEEAMNFLITKIHKTKRFSQTNEELAKKQKMMLIEKIIRSDLLHHLGEDIPKKRVFISLMANKLLNTMLNRLDVDDRDALENKRIETPGVLLGQLFRQNWKKMLSEIGKVFRKKNTSDDNPINVIVQIKPNVIEQGIKTALATGLWGMQRTKNGVAQALQRLSWIQSTSYLRRILTPATDAVTSSVISIRLVNNNQYKFLCCVETPEGSKIGIVKSLAMMSSITIQNNSQEKILKTILDLDENIKHPIDVSPLEMNKYVKIFINGDWYGIISIKKSNELYEMLKEKRRNAIIEKYVSILFDYNKKEIKMYFDGGRLIRPLLIVDNNKLNLTDEIIKDINKEVNSSDINRSWHRLLSKYKNLIEYEDIETCNYLMISEKAKKLQETLQNQNSVVEYTESTKINRYGEYKWVRYSHCEFHGWVMLGTTAANIAFANHDYATKSIVHFSQAKQSIGIYLTSYKDRMDISQVLYHPQIPLVQTEAMKYNNALDLPYGENTIVAIMSYTGFNQEDSLVLNQSSIDRGIFRADSLKKYHSEIVKNPSTSQDDIFTKPDLNKVTGMKQGNYSKLNDKGFVPEETEITNNDIIIGKVSPIQPTGNNNKVYKDNSELFKSNVDGVIDRVHTGVYNSEGYEMYNVRVRMERIPIIGDKFCQKGTTEILTDNGWITLKDIDIIKHKVATFDDNNNLIYINPSEKFEFDYDGKMYYYKNKHIHIDCTSNHKLYVKSRNSNNFELIEAEKVYGKMYKMKNNINNSFKDNKIININNKEYEINELLKLVGMYISDGCINNNILYISCVKERKVNYCKQFLDNLKINYTYSKDEKYSINDKNLVEYFNSEIGNGTLNKKLPKFVWNLSEIQSRILLESLLEGDGHTDKTGFSRFGTINLQLANDISRLAFHCGWAGHIKLAGKAGKESHGVRNLGIRAGEQVNIIQQNDYYKISIIRNHNEPWINKKNNKSNEEKYYDYNGKVYCIEVPNSHVYYMRENILSPPVWTGNSNRHG